VIFSEQLLPRSLAVAVFVACMAAMVPACSPRTACYFTRRCQGQTLQSCGVDDDTGVASESATDCAASGRVCLQSDLDVACVFPDQPCTSHACVGNHIAYCSLLGLVESYVNCTNEDPARTCVMDAEGPMCGYPAITCPASGAHAVCGPDGTSVYSGCGIEGPHPAHRQDCGADGNVCTTANGYAGCANPAFIACTFNEIFCSADRTKAYGCNSSLGLVSRTDDCAARGQICKDGSCGFDVACDRTTTDSRCSSDGATVYVCGSNGLASSRMTCDTGKSCAERTVNAVTFAGCR
jgi:hypothetical protein